MLSTNVLLFNLLLSVILPAFTAFVTHKNAPSWVKTEVLTVLAAVGGVLTQVLANGGNFHWKQSVLSFGSLMIASVAAHFGILKPAQLTGADGLISKYIPGGFGKSLATMLNQGNAQGVVDGDEPMTTSEFKDWVTEALHDIFRTNPNATPTITINNPPVVPVEDPVTEPVVVPDPVPTPAPVVVPDPAPQTEAAPSLEDAPVVDTTEVAPVPDATPTPVV